MEITEDILYFWLGFSGLSARRFHKLSERYTPWELWSGVGNTITDKTLFGEKTYDALVRFRNVDFLSHETEKLRDGGMLVVSFNRYPLPLRQKEVVAPPFLYCRGNVSLLHTPTVAVVGTRQCSAYGKEAAYRLATELCEHNVTVASGLALGIDSYAHRAVLRANGKTVAVLGSGLQCVTPPFNQGLHDEIVASGGLIVSEYAPRCDATRYTFPARNRIISGLSMGTVVVEAGKGSGALITADYAAEQGRTVFAVPGSILSKTAVGSNRLLYDGAVPALCATDICDTLGISYTKIEKKPSVVALDIFEQKIYNLLQSGITNFDALVESAQITPAKLSALLSGMEIKRVIEKKAPNVYAPV